MIIKLGGVAHLCRGISSTSVCSRQKVAYVQRYKWLLDVCKSRQRAKYPWIPREPPTSCLINGKVQEIPEMRVEFVVPDNLDNCELKPYVSWRAEVINEPPLTSKSLFDMRYSDRVIQLHKTGSSPEEIISKL